METIYFLIIFFVALELFESNWQKADTLFGVLENNYKVYQKGILLFFLLNPTFIYSIYLSISLNNFTFLMNCIIILKFADISLRLHLCNKINKNENIESVIPADFQYNNLIRYINVIIYPTTFFFSTF